MRMLPLQAITDPEMIVVFLSILLVFTIISGFIWAYGKINESPNHELGEDNHRSHT